MRVSIYNGLCRYCLLAEKNGETYLKRIGMKKSEDGQWKSTCGETEGPYLPELKKLIILIKPDDSAQLIEVKKLSDK